MNLIIKQWGRYEFDILEDAESRMGIFCANNHYYKNELSAQHINISPELYDFIWTNYSLQNNIDNVCHKLPLTKSSSNESSDTRYDCVPIAISHCGTKTYEQVAAICDRFDSGWRSRGVDLGYAASIMENCDCGTVTTYHNSNEIVTRYDTSTVNLNAMMVYETYNSDCNYHAVNAYKYVGGQRSHKIFYNDYQNNLTDRWKFVSSVDCMFVCN